MVGVGLLLLASCGLEGDEQGSFDEDLEREALYTFSGLPSGYRTVNGHALKLIEQKSLRYVAERIVSPLRRYHGKGRSDALDKAALIAWWSLKEGGSMRLDKTATKEWWQSNPIAYSLCDRPRENLTAALAGTCFKHAWQVGIASVQAPRPRKGTSECNRFSTPPPSCTGNSSVNWFTSHIDTYVDRYQNIVRKAYPPSKDESWGLDPVRWALKKTAAHAGRSSTKQTEVANSRRYVRAAWLLRVGVVGFVDNYPTIQYGCHRKKSDGTWAAAAAWCFSTGWDASEKYAANRTAMLASIRDIRRILDKIAP